MNISNIKLPGARLAAALSYVRKGAVLADIGTDHACLPIYAAQNGLISRAVASDVNSGPLVRAIENVKKSGLETLIECVLTSGFDGMEEMGITDAAICGMGGELIADIIENAGFIKHSGMRLIVQPMTMPDAARRAMLRSGFQIVSEMTVAEDRKYYTVICADYCGAEHTIDEFTALFGDFAVKNFESDAVRLGYLRHEIAKYDRIIKGKSISGLDTGAERMIIQKLSEKLQEGNVECQ